MGQDSTHLGTKFMVIHGHDNVYPGCRVQNRVFGGKLGKPIPFQPARSSDRKAGCSNGRSHWGMLVLSSSCASFCNIVTLEFQHLSASILAFRAFDFVAYYDTSI